MRPFRSSKTARSRERARIVFSAALAAGSLLPCAAAASGASSDIEAQVVSAFEEARAALATEEGRLDELAARNGRRALSDGRESSGQAASNIRLWQNDIERKEELERRLLEQLRGKLTHLRPEIASLAERLSPAVADPSPSDGPLVRAEFERRVRHALETARNALRAEEGRLDELAARNSRRAMSDGRQSSGQSAASVRLLNHDIRSKKAAEAGLLGRLQDNLVRLGPDLAALSERLSGSPLDPPKGVSGVDPGRADSGPAPDAGEVLKTDPALAHAGGAPSGATGAELPLRRESSVLYRRVLSLPGAALHREPLATDGPESEAVRTFSVFYVYETRLVEGREWLRIGRSIQRGSEGWIAARETEEWRNMLVMQFPSRANRRRVLFFDDEGRLRELLDSFQREREVAFLHDVVESGDAAGTVGGLVAVEPAEAIAADARPYLMPILDWRTNVVVADTGDIATLVQVAGLNAEAEPDASAEVAAAGETDLAGLDLGIAFVIDTTRSMGPYIRAAREIVVRFAREIRREGLEQFVDFALVGYRDNTAPNPQIEYISRIYRDFGSPGSVDTLERELGRARISPASTKDWREDAFAGLRTAIEGLSWSPHTDARIIVLITDAGARSGNDPLSSNPRYDSLNVLSDAQRRSIAIVPIHLLTPESKRGDDTTRAQKQYRDISVTPEGSNYLALPMGDERVFRAELQAMAANLRTLITRLDRDESIEAVREDDTLPQGARTVLKAFETDMLSLAEDSDGQPKPRLAAIVQNQLFRAQLQYLGRERGTALPPFYRAWAADLDLENPFYQALDVRVFLTRNQLNELAEVLDLLLDEALATGTTAESFMERLQHLSAAMSVDPNLRSGEAEGGDTIGSLLPGFLKELPYRSNIFDLSLRDFANATVQTETFEQLGYKLEQYRRINGDTAGWLDLGSGDPGEFVYPIQLRLLP